MRGIGGKQILAIFFKFYIYTYQYICFKLSQIILLVMVRMHVNNLPSDIVLCKWDGHGS